MCFSVTHFYSPNHFPTAILELPDEENWFNGINNNGCTESSQIFKGNFMEPLPVLQTGKAVFGTTTDGALLFILKVSSNEVLAIICGQSFSDNCKDEALLHSSMTARDQKEKVAVKLYFYPECNDLHSKLLALSTFNQQFAVNVKKTPCLLEINNQETEVDNTLLNKVMTFNVTCTFLIQFS